MLVKLDHFPRDRGENKKYLKPPPNLVLLSPCLYKWYLYDSPCLFFKLFSILCPFYSFCAVVSSALRRHFVIFVYPRWIFEPTSFLRWSQSWLTVGSIILLGELNFGELPQQTAKFGGLGSFWRTSEAVSKSHQHHKRFNNTCNLLAVLEWNMPRIKVFLKGNSQSKTMANYENKSAWCKSLRSLDKIRPLWY